MILCSISTRGRYDTTLPMAIMSVINQTLKPNKLIIFDDNDNPEDLRDRQLYKHLFQILDFKGIEWAVEYGQRKGQHYNHQRANTMGFEWVWRLDDDTTAEPDTLENLYKLTGPDIGAVGGSVLTPSWGCEPRVASGKIENLDVEPSIQWGYITETKEVDHLHCSFLYRAGVCDYNLGLSKVAHREETLFTYNLKKKGFKILVTPAVTWHFKSDQGGIRDGVKELYDHDNYLFWTSINHSIVILDNGMGDHIVFRKILPEIKNPLIFSCYPEIIPGKSIGEAQALFGDLMPYNIYAKMDQWNWKGSLEDAFRKMYNIPRKK